MNYESAHAMILAGRDKKSRPVANNTRLETRPIPSREGKMIADNDIALRLHGTDVVTFHPDGSITLDSGGWLTMTTRDRMNYADGIRVYQDRGRWFVVVGPQGETAVTAPYFDGMRINVTQRIVVNASDGPNLAAEDNANKAMKKQVSAYVALYTDERIRELVELAQANGARGDCLFCRLSDPGSDSSHLISHLEESYVMVSTLLNAVRAKGYPNPAVILSFAPDLARRVLGSYLRKRLLVGVATR